MYFLALACDYDGTIADDSTVSEAMLAALKRVKSTGRGLILITGRQLDDLKRVFPGFAVFDRIVAENGALAYDPATQAKVRLAPDAPAALIERLRALEVDPLSIGKSIIATSHPQEGKVLQAIRELGLEHQIIFNKGAVMVLPPDVNKASGLAAALRSLNISPLNTVGVGDAENDHAFLKLCGCAVAVANALPALKSEADLVTKNGNGAGVIEVVNELLKDDLASVMRRSNRREA